MSAHISLSSDNDDSHIFLKSEEDSHILLKHEEDGRMKLNSDNVDINTSLENDDYNKLKNKPSIEGHKLIGDTTLDEIGVTIASTYSIYSLFHP